MLRPSVVRHRLAVFVIAAALALALPTTPARSFDLQKHSIMTKQVLGRHGLTGAALSLVA